MDLHKLPQSTELYCCKNDLRISKFIYSTVHGIQNLPGIFHLETKRTLIQFERTRSLRDFLTCTVLSMCFRGSSVFCQGFFLAEDSEETTDVFEARTKRTNNFPLNHTRLQFEEKKYIVLCLAENLVQEMHRILSSKLSEASSTSRHIVRREQFVGKLPKFAIV